MQSCSWLPPILEAGSEDRRTTLNAFGAVAKRRGCPFCRDPLFNNRFDDADALASQYG